MKQQTIEHAELATMYYPKIDSQGLSRDFSQSPGTEIEEKLDGSQMSFACPMVDGKMQLMFFNRGQSIKTPLMMCFTRQSVC